ncbi:hypothetical protein TheetDRAFT_2627 [Thermoanaerobacter ethanolicus JW 200]|uniref:FxLYD domain-containing protein n=1 Tax=Thermoanaerobacter ethanolicus TaxID=1757 RepID=UPI000202EE90|nr:hypothetical protein TheetDRAFT_2627 [Thermoanaerobacter ethanolicus JW 200]
MENQNKYWLIPFSFAVIIVFALVVYVFYEIGIDKRVEEMRIKAEEMALEGNFDAALNLVKSGLALRPNHKVLQQDLTLINFGKTLYQKLETAKKDADDKEFDKALETVSTVEKELENRNGEYFDMLRKLVNKYKGEIEVKQIYYLVADKNTIDELADALSRLAYIDNPEAKKVDKLIREKIVNIAYSTANEMLKDKQYNKALEVIEKALQYDSSNDKLISFKKTIIEQKTAFEKAEAQRMEEALIAAAQEEAINRTNAVRVLSIKGYTNEYGDLIIEGEIENVAKRPIYAVEVYYNIYDADGNVVGYGSAYVYPSYLMPLQRGSFSNMHYGIFNAAHVTVTRVTWYLN